LHCGTCRRYGGHVAGQRVPRAAGRRPGAAGDPGTETLTGGVAGHPPFDVATSGKLASSTNMQHAPQYRGISSPTPRPRRGDRGRTVVPAAETARRRPARQGSSSGPDRSFGMLRPHGEYRQALMALASARTGSAQADAQYGETSAVLREGCREGGDSLHAHPLIKPQPNRAGPGSQQAGRAH